MLEVADIFRAHGPSWRHEQRSHLSVGQLKVMSAIKSIAHSVPDWGNRILVDATNPLVPAW